MAMESIVEIVRNFIRTDLSKESGITRLELGDNLLELRILDSLGIQKLLGFLECTFLIEISDDEVLPDNFETIEAICAFVNRKAKVAPRL